MNYFKRKNIKDPDVWNLPKHIYSEWNQLSLEMLQLVFDQAEKYLGETVKAGEDMTIKALKILGVAIAILTISLGYIFTEENPIEIILTAAIITSILCFSSIAYLIKPIWAYNIFVKGTEPKELLSNPKNITAYQTPKLQSKNILAIECRSYQKRINYNTRLNKKRASKVNYAMICLILVPISLFLSWGLDKWFDLF